MKRQDEDVLWQALNIAKGLIESLEYVNHYKPIHHHHTTELSVIENNLSYIYTSVGFFSYPGQCSVMRVEGEATGFSLLSVFYLIVVYCTYLNGHLRAHVQMTAWYKTIQRSSSQSGERISRHETLRWASLLFEMALNEAAFLSLCASVV